MQVGTRVNAKTVIARWGFGEFRTTRWAAGYASFNPQAIRQGVPFDQLTSQEVDHLEHMTRQFRAGMVGDVDANPIWECQEWNKDRLGRTSKMGQRDIRLPFLVAGILTLINWVYGLMVLPESLPVDRRRVFSWRRANPVGAFKSSRK